MKLAHRVQKLERLEALARPSASMDQNGHSTRLRSG